MLPHFAPVCKPSGRSFYRQHLLQAVNPSSFASERGTFSGSFIPLQVDFFVVLLSAMGRDPNHLFGFSADRNLPNHRSLPRWERFQSFGCCGCRRNKGYAQAQRQRCCKNAKILLHCVFLLSTVCFHSLKWKCVIFIIAFYIIK